MKLPNELEDIIKSCEVEVSNNQTGELKLPLRKKIWKFFGEIKIGEQYRAIITVGLKRRVILSILCIIKVIDEWNNVLPDDNSINYMICMMEQYIAGEIAIEEIISYINTNSTRMENLAYKNERLQKASLIGLTTIKAMGRTLHDENLIIFDKENATDQDYDCYDIDVAYYAAVVYSNGGPWDLNSSIEKRREFWLWYVQKAVPEAYLASTD